MRSSRNNRWSTVVALFVAVATSAVAQESVPSSVESPQTILHVSKLEHQSAQDALDLLLPLLSDIGTVEIQPAANTIVVRDTAASMARILPVIEAFDHPSRPVRIEIHLVRGYRAPAVSGDPEPEVEPVPPGLEAQLVGSLPFERFELLSTSRVDGSEGERVVFDLGSEYHVRFRVGTVISASRIRLHQFEVLRGESQMESERLLRSNLNLWLDRTTVLALTGRRAAASALVVVVVCRLLPGGGG